MDWINRNKHLPSKSGKYLVVFAWIDAFTEELKQSIEIDHYSNQFFCFHSEMRTGINVTHWAELPEMPEEESITPP